MEYNFLSPSRKKGHLISCKWWVISALLLILFSCSGGKKEIPEIKTPVHIRMERFDQDVFQLPVSRDSLLAALPAFKEKYGNFLDIFNSAILNEQNMADPIYYDVLQSYLSDRTIFILKQTVDSVFPKLDRFGLEVDDAFSNYHYYFPDKPLPRVVSYISGLNQSFITADTLIGIALDKFLGRTNIVYAQAMMPLYQRNGMSPERMVPDCIRAWMLTEFPAGDSVRNLLDNMIYEGKIEYVKGQLMPGYPDTVLIGFTQKQLEWCRKYENRMWTYLVEKKLIFVTDAFTISKFTQEGPFTKDFSNESPARAAVWIGSKIVESYMKQNKNVSLEQLMSDRNAYRLLEKSKYNP